METDIEHLSSPKLFPHKSQPIIVKVYSTHFEPSIVTCNCDTSIRWVIIPSNEQNCRSLYYGCTREHVIGFEQIGIESPYLYENCCYEVTFHLPGTYNYKCLIFGNMKGCVEVLPEDDVFITTEDIIKGRKISKSVYSVATSTDIEKVTPEENLELMMKEESIKKIINKYMKKAKWELPMQLSIEMEKIEKNLPFFKEDMKEKMRLRKQRNRNRRRRHKQAKNVFMETWNGQPQLFRHLLRINFPRMWTRVRQTNEIKIKSTPSKLFIIQSCMNLSS